MKAIWIIWLGLLILANPLFPMHTNLNLPHFILPLKLCVSSSCAPSKGSSQKKCLETMCEFIVDDISIIHSPYSYVFKVLQSKEALAIHTTNILWLQEIYTSCNGKTLLAQLTSVSASRLAIEELLQAWMCNGRSQIS